MSDFLPCPFCGGEAEFETYGGTACAVVCQSCRCGTPTMSLTGGMAAVNRWNLRAERTCRIVEDEEGDSVCSECGADYLCMTDASYCPDCGRKVVR